MQAFTSNAKNNDNYEFLVTFNSQVFAEFSITSDSVVIFKQVNTNWAAILCWPVAGQFDCSDTLFALFLFSQLVYVAW